MNFRDSSRLVEPTPDDSRAIGREKRAAVVAGRVGQAGLLGAVVVHDVDFTKVGKIDFKELFLLLCQVIRVGAAR